MRVVIADDSALIREGLARLLTDTGIEVLALAADADQLLRDVATYHPDVAIVDIRMPPTHTDEGLRAVAHLRRHHPATAVLVLSQHLTVRYALDLLGEGTQGVGYLLKDRVGDLAEFTDALRRVASGGSALDPQVVAHLIAHQRSAPNPLDELTDRERDVLALMAEGRSNHAIARDLVIAESTVEKHIASIFSKLQISPSLHDHRRVLAVLTHLRQSL
ncbi:MAG: response regulator [Pseudonocardiaceae bacterium]